MPKIQPNANDFMSDEEIEELAEHLASNQHSLLSKSEFARLIRAAEISDPGQLTHLVNWAQETQARTSLLDGLLDGTLFVKVEGEELVFLDERLVN